MKLPYLIGYIFGVCSHCFPADNSQPTSTLVNPSLLTDIKANSASESKTSIKSMSDYPFYIGPYRAVIWFDTTGQKIKIIINIMITAQQQQSDHPPSVRYQDVSITVKDNQSKIVKCAATRKFEFFSGMEKRGNMSEQGEFVIDSADGKDLRSISVKWLDHSGSLSLP